MLFVCLFCCLGRIPKDITYLAQPLCWSGWEISSPTTHRGAVRKGGAEIPLLTSPFILNNSVITAAPFNVVIHPRCCEPKHVSLERFRPLAVVRTCDRWHRMSFLGFVVYVIKQISNSIFLVLFPTILFT